MLLICYLFCIFVAGNKRLITMSKKKTELSTKEKQPVKIRYKKLANGNLSIYLDIYQNGKRNYKFLKLYLVPETNEKAKAINRKNMDLAEAIKAQMIIQLNTTIHGLSNQKESSSIYNRLLLNIL